MEFIDTNEIVLLAQIFKRNFDPDIYHKKEALPLKALVGNQSSILLETEKYSGASYASGYTTNVFSNDYFQRW